MYRRNGQGVKFTVNHAKFENPGQDLWGAYIPIPIPITIPRGRTFFLPLQYFIFVNVITKRKPKGLSSINPILINDSYSY